MNGLISIRSSFGPDETMSRLEAEISAKGLTIFARIDHAAGATEAGLKLRPTLLFVFGNARGGTPLMQSAQTTGIDLPLKALVWQDGAGQTWISYNDPGWIVQRHGVAGTDAIVAKMADQLSAISNAAAGNLSLPKQSITKEPPHESTTQIRNATNEI